MLDKEMKSIAKEVKEFLATETINELKSTNEEDLIDWHHSLGQHIRNKYKLWSRSWTPNIVNGIDMSEDHPDTLSMKIVTEIYNMLRLESNNE